MRRLYKWWIEDRPIWWHKDFRWGWLGSGWNMLHLGFITLSFKSGESPRARLKRWRRAT